MSKANAIDGMEIESKAGAASVQYLDQKQGVRVRISRNFSTAAAWKVRSRVPRTRHHAMR